MSRVGVRDWMARRRRADGGAAAGGVASGGAVAGSAVSGGAEPAGGTTGTGEAPPAAARRRPAAGDGGWRAVTPLVPTLAGAGHGVSDGLRFRSRLASWQDPSLCGPLGHAVLPTAPVGILRAVAAPGGPATVVGSGDELVLPVGAVGGAEDGEAVGRPEGAGERRQVLPVQRAVRARRLPVRPAPRAAGAAAGAAVGTGAGVRQAGAAGAAVGEVATPGAARPGAPVPGSGQPERWTSDVPVPAAPEAGTQAPSGTATPDATAASPRPVRPRPVGGPLTVARRPRVLPVRPVAAVPASGRAHEVVTEPPSADVDPALPVAGTAGPAGTPGPFSSGESAVPTQAGTVEGAVQRAAATGADAPARPVLGAPLTALPASASPVAAPDPRPAERDPGAPAMPVVRAATESAAPEASGPDSARQPGARSERWPVGGLPVQRTSSEQPAGTAPGTAPSPASARTRGGLGAPLDALPPSAAAPGGPAPTLGGRRPVRRVTGPAAGGAGDRSVGGSAAGGARDRSVGGSAERSAPPVGEGPRVQRSTARAGSSATGSTPLPLAENAEQAARRSGLAEPQATGGPGREGAPVKAVTVPVRPAVGGLGVQRAVELVGRRRGLIGTRPIPAALATPAAPFAGTAAPTGSRTASPPRPPVVPAVWPNALASRTDDDGPAGGPSPTAGGGSGEGIAAAPQRSGARRTSSAGESRAVAGQSAAGAAGGSSGSSGSSGSGVVRGVVSAVQRARSSRAVEGESGRTAADRPTAQRSSASNGAPGATEAVDRPSGPGGVRGVVAAVQRSRSRRASERGGGRRAADPPVHQGSSSLPVAPGGATAAGVTGAVAGGQRPRSRRAKGNRSSSQGSSASPAASPMASPPSSRPRRPGAAVPPTHVVRLAPSSVQRVPSPELATGPSPVVPRALPPGHAASTPPAPVVRPAPPAGHSLQRLPTVSRPLPSPPTPTPTPTPAAPSPVVSRALAPARPVSTPPAGPASNPPAPHAPGTAQLLQRVAEQAGLTGVPLTAVPARRPSTVQAAPPKASPAKASPAKASPPAESATAPGGAGPGDLDELARRLVEPVGRLLRTELRRGRERAGRPYDLRR